MNRSSDKNIEPKRKRGNGAQQAQAYELFVSLLARNEPSIRRFVRSLLPTAEGVDDVVQETALECWKKFDDFDPDIAASHSESQAVPVASSLTEHSSTKDNSGATRPSQASDAFVRWACVIARFKVLSWQRDQSRDRLRFRDEVVRSLADTAIDQLGRREQERDAIEKCLQELGHEERRLVLSVHFPGESVARIAAETGQQARRLYTQVNHLRRQLLQCINRRLAQEASI